jgi:hypothetical protein
MLHKPANKTAPNRIFFPVGDIAHNRLTAMSGTDCGKVRRIGAPFYSRYNVAEQVTGRRKRRPGFPVAATL